jgi:uncharacterized protein (TIGR03083 family)
MSASTEQPVVQHTRSAALDHKTAMRLAAVEYQRCVAQLRELPPDAWAKPTACPDWDVHAMACHVLGMAEFAATAREQIRQLRTAKRADGPFLDALTALQVRKHADRSPAELMDMLSAVGPRAARHRRRAPALIRRIPMKDQPVDETGENIETWAYGFLVDIILTRDPWMHRSDIADAAGIEMTLTVEHDGVLIADVVTEWGARHGQPCALTLTGPGGGSWTWGIGGPNYHLDAIEFCRTVSGRIPADGLLRTRVPF